MSSSRTATVRDIKSLTAPYLTLGHRHNIKQIQLIKMPKRILVMLLQGPRTIVQYHKGHVAMMWDKFRTFAPDALEDDLDTLRERFQQCKQSVRRKLTLRRSKSLAASAFYYEVWLACIQDMGLDPRLLPDLRYAIESEWDKFKNPRLQIPRKIPKDSETMLNWILDIKKRGLDAQDSIWHDAHCGYVTDKTKQVAKMKEGIAAVGLEVLPRGA